MLNICPTCGAHWQSDGCCTNGHPRPKEITFPGGVEISPGVYIIAQEGGLYRMDSRPGAFCPAETRFGDKANYLAYISLLSPQLLGATGLTTPARRAAWAYSTRYAQRFLRWFQSNL